MNVNSAGDRRASEMTTEQPWADAVERVGHSDPTGTRGDLRDPNRLMGYVRTVVRARWQDISKKSSNNGVTTPISRARMCSLTTTPTRT